MLKADPKNSKQIGSGIPGTVLKVLVNEGEEVKQNQALVIVEAMKNEAEMVASEDGKVKRIYVSDGQSVQSGELIVGNGISFNLLEKLKKRSDHPNKDDHFFFMCLIG